MIYRLLLGIVCTTSALVATELDHLADIMPHVKAETLVIFDIDDTLIKPAQTLGEAAWGPSLLHDLERAGCSQKQIERRVWRRLYLSEVKPVEPDTVPIVQELQCRRIHVMGLTARPPELAWFTRRQLGHIGIDLGRTALSRAPLQLEVEGQCAGYVRGILYTDHADKGSALREYLACIRHMPPAILYVDDRAHRVAQVEEAAEEMGIPCLCFHYRLGQQERERET